MPQGEVAPEPWASAMEAVGAVSSRTGKASINELARMSGVHATTIQRMIYKERLGAQGATMNTIEKVAAALNQDPAIVAKWAGTPGKGNGRFIPPKEADLLSPRGRRLVAELIKTLVAESKNGTPARR